MVFSSSSQIASAPVIRWTRSPPLIPHTNLNHLKQLPENFLKFWNKILILRISNNDMSVRWLNAVFKTDLTHIAAQFSYEDPSEKQKELYVVNIDLFLRSLF